MRHHGRIGQNTFDATEADGRKHQLATLKQRLRGRVEKALAHGGVEIDNVAHKQIDETRIVVHHQVEVLHANQVNRIVPER